MGLSSARRYIGMARLALMKGLVDRFVYFNSPENRGWIRGKSAVLAVPFEEGDPEAAARLVAFFEKSLQ
jgi:hypothetical protein